MTCKLTLLILVAGLLQAHCAPHFPPSRSTPARPRLTETAFITADGTELPLKIWSPAALPRDVCIALHGYNDYSNFIKDAAVYFKNHGVAVYAYDQREFGNTPQPGQWCGRAAMAEDLRTFIALVQERHPAIPLYLLGDSMGGAVILTADRPLPGDGVILVAPAVWARTFMPFYQRWALWLGARLVPWLRVTPDWLDITASDNKKMLKALRRDALVLKESRIDAIYGLANLMDAASEAAVRFDKKVLFLYGAKDEIIPKKPMGWVFRERLQRHFTMPQRLLVYKNGYHMLLRDLQAEVVWDDILFWMTSPSGSFPSVPAGAAIEVRTEQDIKAAFNPAPGN